MYKPDGTMENFNKMIFDAGQACVWDFRDNPADWWGGRFRLASASRERLRPRFSLEQRAFRGSTKSDEYLTQTAHGAKKIAPANFVAFASSDGQSCWI